MNNWHFRCIERGNGVEKLTRCTTLLINSTGNRSASDIELNYFNAKYSIVQCTVQLHRCAPYHDKLTGSSEVRQVSVMNNKGEVGWG